VFQKALTLPGTGVKRFRDKPRLVSDGEKMAALFNIACCHSRLGEAREGLLALSGAPGAVLLPAWRPEALLYIVGCGRADALCCGVCLASGAWL
jgi:hypothetical protein